MVKQLVTNQQELTAVTVFSRQQLIEYTREIQERCKQTVNEAIKNSGIDFDDMVELELNYDKTIEVLFDNLSLYKEIESAIDDAFETDDEAIYSEAMDVIENMNEVQCVCYFNYADWHLKVGAFLFGLRGKGCYIQVIIKNNNNMSKQTAVEWLI